MQFPPLNPGSAVFRPLPRSGRRAGFTLLEIVLAAAILVIISVTVYEFTSVTIRTTDFSVRESENTMNCGGLRRLIESQLASLPANMNGALIGMLVNNKGGSRRDALQLVCPAGNPLLTPDAKGLYEITWTVREIPRGSGKYTLGMERTPWEDDNADDDDDDPSANVGKVSSTKVADVKKVREVLPSDWVAVMDGVKSLECSYFDARLNGWVDKWTDTSTLPNLLRVRLSLVNGGEPYEIVERVPGGSANTRVIPVFTPTTPGAQQVNPSNATVARPIAPAANQ